MRWGEREKHRFKRDASIGFLPHAPQLGLGIKPATSVLGPTGQDENRCFLKNISKHSNIAFLKVLDFPEWYSSYYIVRSTEDVCCCHLYDIRIGFGMNMEMKGNYHSPHLGRGSPLGYKEGVKTMVKRR